MFNIILVSVAALAVLSLITVVFVSHKRKEKDRILRKHGLSNVVIPPQDDQHLFE